MNVIDRLAYSPKFSVWRIENRAVRALAMWASVLFALPLYLLWEIVVVIGFGLGMLAIAIVLHPMTYLRSLPWRNIGRAMFGREATW